MKTLVFSDVHLDVADAGRDARDAFVRFLRQIDPGEVCRVIVLGDLFDFWFEYRHVVFSGYFDVLRAFADLHDGGVELVFVCGNHDFWAGRFLERHLGFTIHDDSCLIDLGGKRTLLMHGDGLNKKDIGYRIYKRIARARPVVWLFGLLHPDWAMGLAQCVSRTSTRVADTPDFSKGSEAAALRAHAERALAAGEADVIMCGHSHHAVIEEYPTPDGAGLYINAGGWLWSRTYVEWEAGEFRLRSFEAEQPPA
ncbi:MAG: UDP-2,3-diacylglucosamine diphosphatase [Candidatus Hydrogenedentes bacterium]|nr:UDP-2,3-diacylglucosamine diphosphatase [Candidatus Hydrogenedentota bacterium]